MKQSTASRSFYIKTMGCQMNVADSQRMSVILSDLGCKPAANPQCADIVILNGCEVREKAFHKALSALGTLKEKNVSPASVSRLATHISDQKKPGQIIGLGGCVGQLEGAKLFKRNPHLDFVFGTDTIDSLPEIIHQVQAGSRHLVFNDFDEKQKPYTTETKIYNKSASAFVNIMKGCDKHCSYCIVPFTRGREKSRTIAEVHDDVQRLVLTGVCEVTLLGQNVNSFDEDFPQLLRTLDSVKGLKRLRYTSSHPVDFSDDLINCYGEVKALCNQLHLPVQSGSNKVLQKMSRHYKIETYLEQIEKWRKRCPSGGLSTDMIVGFPTETDADFEQTMQLIEAVKYDMIYAFSYSPRPGTRAANMKDDVPAHVKHERLLHLQKRSVEIARGINQKLVGHTLEVLVEGKTKSLKNSNDTRQMFSARTSCNKVVNFPADGTVAGKFVNVKITSASGLALLGLTDGIN